MNLMARSLVSLNFTSFELKTEYEWFGSSSPPPWPEVTAVTQSLMAPCPLFEILGLFWRRLVVI